MKTIFFGQSYKKASRQWFQIDLKFVSNIIYLIINFKFIKFILKYLSRELKWITWIWSFWADFCIFWLLQIKINPWLDWVKDYSCRAPRRIIAAMIRNWNLDVTLKLGIFWVYYYIKFRYKVNTLIHTSLFNQILGIMKTPLINKEVQEAFLKIIKK